MFLDKTLERNPNLIKYAFNLHQKGQIRPDSYVIDLDTLLENAKAILDKANENGIHLYFMMKQLGRNPLIAKELIKLGYTGAVAVDYKEAQVLMKHRIPLGNVGHLVQIPTHFIKEILTYGCEVMTVYSLDKIKEINQIAGQLKKTQPIMLRVCGKDDLIYSGQKAGFMLSEIKGLVEKVSELRNVKIVGVTSFPCFMYNEEDLKLKPTPNLKTVLLAAEQLKKMGMEITQINTPSATCAFTIDEMAKYGVTHAEPGHGLTGTTPAHAVRNLTERPSVVYVTEVSHNFDQKAYCFGGGYYRRSNMESALVGKSLEGCSKLDLLLPSLESIDYHFGLESQCNIGDSVIMAFRYQIFVTRSDVMIVRGIASKQPRIIGRYDALGNEL